MLTGESRQCGGHRKVNPSVLTSILTGCALLLQVCGLQAALQ